MLSFLTSQLVDNEFSPSPVQPTELSFGLRLAPLEQSGRHHGPGPHVRLYCQPYGGRQLSFGFIDGLLPGPALWAYAN